jgi:hypothetical protein
MKALAFGLAILFYASPVLALAVEHLYTANPSFCHVEAGSASTAIAYNTFGVNNLSTSATLTTSCAIQIEQTAGTDKMAYGLSGAVCAYNTFRRPFVEIWDVNPNANVTCTLYNLNPDGSPHSAWTVTSSGSSGGAVPQIFNVIEPVPVMVGGWYLKCTIPPALPNGAASSVSQLLISSCSIH